jgi:hypothetical protein
MRNRSRALLTTAVGVAVLSLLAWQSLHGGVPAHSFMARDDMPSISNWWGALTLPLLTWLALGNTQSRIATGRTSSKAALMGAIGAAVFGAVLATAFALGHSEIPNAQVQLIPLLALAFPIYRSEYILGFVLSLSYTFGGVLPLVIGTVFALGGAALYLAPRWLILRLRRKV